MHTAREIPHGTLGIVAPKSPASAIIRLDVGEELRAMRMQGLKHVAAIAELRSRVQALEGRWGAPMIAAVAAIVTALGSVGYLVLSHH